MSAWLLPSVLSCCTLLVVTGCGSEPPSRTAWPADSVPREHPPAERIFQPFSWDTLAEIGGSVDDSLLLRPLLLAAAAGRLFVYDYGDDRVKAFARDGSTLWISGRSGEGPGEFVNAFDIEVGDTSVWVVDEGAGRITILRTSDGRHIGQVPFGSRLFRDVIPLSDANALGLLVGPGEDFIFRMDTTGAILETYPYPTLALAEARYLLRQPMAAARTEDHQGTAPRWAAMFPFGDEFFSYAGPELICIGGMIRALDMTAQPADRQPAASAADIAMTDSTVLLIAADSGESRLRAVDEYDWNTCQYLGSQRIPVAARAIAWSQGTLFLQHDDPAPGILALRSRQGESAIEN